MTFLHSITRKHYLLIVLALIVLSLAFLGFFEASDRLADAIGHTAEQFVAVDSTL